MTSMAILASLLMATPAAADQSNSSMENKVVGALTDESMGNGPVIELDVFGLSSGLSGTSVSFFGSNAGAVPLIVIPSVMVGWEWDQMAMLIGAQFITTAGVAGQSGKVAVAVPFTVRRYLKPLVVYGFSPFVEGSFDLDFVVPPGQGLSLGFGINVGFGGEYVFARNFGLFGKALLGYMHIPSSVNGQTTNTDAAGIGGVMGILIHF